MSDFKQWITVALPNDKYIYCVGWHLTETIMSEKLRDLAYDYSTKGELYLVQEKTQDRGLINYTAIKASKPPIQKLVPLAITGIRDRQETKHKAAREVVTWLRRTQ